VYARGVDRQLIFRDAFDCRHYLSVLGGVVLHRKWRCLSYCLMPNHVHLLVQLTEANLGRGVQHVHGLYGRDFNARHGRVGHLFQGRYGVTVIRDELQFLTAVRYIALNPVAAGLCAAADDWDWGSYPAVMDGTCPRWLDTDQLASLAEWDGEPRQCYRSLLEAG
jgi:REP element-mobilizing transposase RayT